MATKDRILELLLSCRESYLSGVELAMSLGVSRAAVWKGVKALRDGGFPIVGQPNRGYCLETGADILSVHGILGLLDPGGPWKLELRDCVPLPMPCCRNRPLGARRRGRCCWPFLRARAGGAWADLFSPRRIPAYT